MDDQNNTTKQTSVFPESLAQLIAESVAWEHAEQRDNGNGAYLTTTQHNIRLEVDDLQTPQGLPRKGVLRVSYCVNYMPEKGKTAKFSPEETQQLAAARSILTAKGGRTAAERKILSNLEALLK